MRLLQLVALGALIVIILALGATAVIGRERALALVFGPAEPTPIDFKTLTRHRRPNQFLMCPKGLCSAAIDVVSPVFDVPATQLRNVGVAVMAQQPRIQQVAADETALQYDFVQRSRLVRFPDLITVRFIPLPATQSTFAVYSRSHIGYSDRGVNRRRIESWLTALKIQLQSKP